MQKNYNLSKILTKEHEGKWVALSPMYDKVIDYSNDLMSLTKRIQNQNVVYMKPTASDSFYAF